MTITTEEAELLAQTHDLVRFITATALRSLAAERDALKAENARLRETADAAARALHKAGEQFAFYANQHAVKGTADGDQKAATNQQWAQRCFSAHDAALGEKDNAQV
jgi:hypothetical protein